MAVWRVKLICVDHLPADKDGKQALAPFSHQPPREVSYKRSHGHPQEKHCLPVSSMFFYGSPEAFTGVVSMCVCELSSGNLDVAST